MMIRDVMTKEMATCTPATNLREVARMMIESDCGAIPVVADDGALRGVVTDRDITCRLVANGENPLEHTAGDCMTEEVICATPDTSLEECCGALEEHMIRRMPVVDENDRVIGIVSQADIARRAGGEKTAEVVQAVSQQAGEASAG